MSEMNDLTPASSESPPARPSLDALVDAVVQSYDGDARTQHIDATFLPSRTKAIDLLEMIRELVFPGFFGRQKLTRENLRFHVGEMIQRIRSALEGQIDTALRYDRNLSEEGHGDACDQCTRQAQQITDTCLNRIPHLRSLLALDVQAAYDGDPAARTTDEAIFSYPGVDAIFTYRVAHELYHLGVPLLPRILSEWAHSKTGIDIHPGANIGHSFFIDHGTGVVIGETTHIGNRVKIYQGVTLGALSFPKDERGRLIRGTKRHPTIEDDVVLYANATVLGGNTVIGRGCIIGGGVFLTRSVPPGHLVSLKSPELRYRSADKHHTPSQSTSIDVIDFQI